MSGKRHQGIWLKTSSSEAARDPTHPHGSVHFFDLFDLGVSELQSLFSTTQFPKKVGHPKIYSKKKTKNYSTIHCFVLDFFFSIICVLIYNLVFVICLTHFLSTVSVGKLG